MTYQPVVVGQGLVSWTFVNRTYDRQFELFTSSRQVQSDTDYFADKIGSIRNGEAFVADRRLLRVALEAFGLGEDLNNRYFIQRILNDGTTAGAQFR